MRPSGVGALCLCVQKVKVTKKLCGKNGAFFPFVRVEKATRRSTKIKKKTPKKKKREEKLSCDTTILVRTRSRT